MNRVGLVAAMPNIDYGVEKLLEDLATKEDLYKSERYTNPLNNISLRQMFSSFLNYIELH